MIESQPGTVTKGCESAILYFLQIREFCRNVHLPSERLTWYTVKHNTSVSALEMGKGIIYQLK